MMSRRSLIVSGVSVAALGGIGYSLWPRMDGYDEEVQRQRQILSSDPTVADLVRMATLAANGHNTQPWKFRLDDKQVGILPDFSRRTEVVDPDDHHLYASLGCAAENLAIAARANGHAARIAVDSRAETPITIELESGAPQDDGLYNAIPLRQSTRSVYDGRPVSSADIDRLTAAADVDGVSVLIFTDQSDREAVLDFVVEGNSAQMDDAAFVAELHDWLRFSPRQALATNDGLFAACTGNPVVPAWIGRLAFDAFFTKDSENDKYRDQIRSSAGVAVFVGDRADPEHWIRVGQSFQRFALQATAMGIRTAHINQPVEVPAVRREFAAWLGTPDVRPDLIIRFGRAPALPMSMRRPVADVVV